VGKEIVPVCIFAKPPIAGKVKTRLIPELGAEAASALASAMLSDVWSVSSSCPGVRSILAAAEAGEFPLSVLEEDIWLQGEGDLGARLERIFIRALALAPAAIALGADSPLVANAHIEEALRALETHEAALGPSTDGGFYLLALKRCPSGLFRDLPWSCAGTLEATKTRLEEYQFSIETITPLFDVDTSEDLGLLGSVLAEMDAAAPATRAWHQRHMRKCT
jgi:rSAM/selenodomain-associated transferase 1